MFISKGRSTHPALNPRYFVFKDINPGAIDASFMVKQQDLPALPAVPVVPAVYA